ncbi:hypothetical protein JTE90_010155 [Oedothorax gibbosus]|uniref:Uncharacterized protein n=1 Tax=Oedothorax gibbosus TaxID=931172 RepID=A0AAV6TUF4_9ARAC|nr:hypothetical protein JTE90_010155 [Oedothorax gibbosus]
MNSAATKAIVKDSLFLDQLIFGCNCNNKNSRIASTVSIVKSDQQVNKCKRLQKSSSENDASGDVTSKNSGKARWALKVANANEELYALILCLKCCASLLVLVNKSFSSGGYS